MGLFSDHFKKTPTQPLLYHYTSQAGLIGILKERTIRATNVLYMNDSAEWWYAFDVARRCLRKIMEGDSEYSQLAHNAAEDLQYWEGKVWNDRYRAVWRYVASFSEEGDMLSQWRAYCPASGGYSLGFDHRRLQKLGLTTGGACHLVKCLYDPETQARMVDELLHADFKRFTDTPRFGIIRFLATFFKDAAFRDENEWRVTTNLATIVKPTAVREGLSTLKPQVDIPLAKEGGKMPIMEIVVGPTPHPVLAADAVYRLAELHGLDSVTVRSSAVPYRGW